MPSEMLPFVVSTVSVVLVCYFKESEHHRISLCMKNMIKALVKPKYSLKSTRQRSIYDETVFPLSHPTLFFPFS